MDVLGAQPGQVLKWDGFEWKPSTDISNGGTADNWGSQYVETEIDIAGIGTEANPLTIARQGALTGQILKWNTKCLHRDHILFLRKMGRL